MKAVCGFCRTEKDCKLVEWDEQPSIEVGWMTNSDYICEDCMNTIVWGDEDAPRYL